MFCENWYPGKYIFFQETKLIVEKYRYSIFQKNAHIYHKINRNASGEKYHSRGVELVKFFDIDDSRELHK